MDPELAKLMARRRRRVEGKSSFHERDKVLPVPSPQEEAVVEGEVEGNDEILNSDSDSKIERDDEIYDTERQNEIGANVSNDTDIALPPTPNAAVKVDADIDINVNDNANANDNVEPETPPQKPRSVASIKEQLYSPSLMDQSDKSGSTLGGILDKSQRSGNSNSQSAIEKIQKDDVRTMPKAPVLQKQSSKGTSGSSSSKEERRRLKRQKSIAEKSRQSQTQSQQQRLSQEEFSELDAVVAAAASTSMESTVIAEEEEKPTPTSSPVANRSPKQVNNDSPKKLSNSPKKPKKPSVASRSSPGPMKKAITSSSSSSSSPGPKVVTEIRSVARSSSPGIMKKVVTGKNSKSPVQSPRLLKKSTVAASTPPPPPVPPPPPSRSKSKSTRNKVRSNRSDDQGDEFQSSPSALRDRNRPERRRSNDDLRSNSRDRIRTANSEESETSSHRRFGRRRSNDSAEELQPSRSPGRLRASSSDDSGIGGEESSSHRRFGRRRSNEDVSGETKSKVERRRSNESLSGDNQSRSKSPGRKKNRRGNRDGVDEGSPGRLKHRSSSSRSHNHDDGDEGSPGRYKQRVRTNSRDEADGTDNATRSPGTHKQTRRSSSNVETDGTDIASRSPGTHKQHRRRLPSRSISRTTSRTKAPSRPKLPVTLEEEISESAAARSESNKRSPHHKMPTTMEDELLGVANSPRITSGKGRVLDMNHQNYNHSPPSSSYGSSNRDTAPISQYVDDEEDSLSGDDLDDIMAPLAKARTRHDSSKRSGRKPSRVKEKPAETTMEEDHEEYEEDLRDDPSDNKFRPQPVLGDQQSSSHSMNFMFQDSGQFENSFEIDLEATGNASRASVNSRNGRDVFDANAFGASFAMDFGSFSEDITTTKPARRKTNTNDDSNLDGFGFSVSELKISEDVEGKDGDYEAPTFGNDAAFGDNLDFGGDWKAEPVSVYDKSPILNPPINQVESMTTKIKWISPHPNMVIASSPKNHNPPPVANPLNGNLIICRPGASQTRDRSCDIIEWNPQRQTQVLAISVLTTDLKRKVIEKYSVAPEAVDTIWTVSAGIHRSESGEALRVAALMDLTILGDRNKEVLRMIAVWDWGNDADGTGSGPRLQTVLSPPSGSDFTYDTKSLKVADGCVFVAGASAKGPCVFLNKPTVRETWSANFIAKNTDLRISSMATTNAPGSPPDPTSDDGNKSASGGLGGQVWCEHRLPFLAIGLNDGSLSVWTYEAATKLTKRTKAETVRKLLFPLCRLHAMKVLQTCPVTPWSSKDRSDSMEKGLLASDLTEVGTCTHLEWIPYRASAHKQLLLLAATFQGALCMYHVALPKIQDKNSGRKGSSYTEIKPPSDKTSLSQTISLKPFCFSKWATTHHRASCAFVDVGPHVPPSLVLLMKGSPSSPDYARVALVTCPLQARHSAHKVKGPGDPLGFHVWDTYEWNNKKASNLPMGLIHSSLTSTRGVLYYTDTAVQELEYRTNTRFPLGASGAGSMPCGLTTSGGNYWADSKSSSGVGVLSLYTTFYSERFKSTMSVESMPTLLEWTIPGRRHWLVQTLAGDCKDSRVPTNKGSKGSSQTGTDDEVVLGGAQSTLVCELVAQPKILNRYPYRMSRNPYSSKDQLHVAIWFRSLYGQSEPKSIGLVERDGDGRYGMTQMFDGRDVVYLPPDGSDADAMPRALVVSPNGGSVHLWRCTKTSKALASPWKKDSSSKPCRPIVGVDPKDTEGFVEFRQFISVRFQDQLSLVAIASGSNYKFCLVAGSLVDEGGTEDWTKLLPNMKEDPILWLEEREQISLVVPLPGEGSIKGGLAVATMQRILILSPDLQILASVDSEIPPASLVPMGSYTVAYCSPMDHKLRYLSALPSEMGRSGVIANFPILTPSFYSPWLVGIRPDRIIYNVHQSGTRLVERGQSSNSFLLPLATTRPALLLEPMVANAIATGSKVLASQPFLRTVMEKFGRKVATMSHGDNEGIGNSGAGITPRVFELLEQYDLKSAASWLLTGTVRFDRSAHSRLMPSYLPVIAKTKAAFDADTHMHLVASGDQYFTEYVKSPDNNMSSTLPRPSDPTAILCRQFAMEAIQEGKIADALKMLDIAGTQSSDSMILQLAMALQLDPSKDTQAVIDALSRVDAQTGKIPSPVASLAALASELKKGTSPSPKFHHKWLQSLAPSVQRSRKGGRSRSRLLGESSLTNMDSSSKIDSDIISKELPESKLVWNEGPNGEKENLLMLDSIGEWFGCNRPIVLGKEGAKSAEERGASTLAGILHSNDDDSFGGENEDAFNNGWVDGVGEGLKDEDKLSAYYRFSEGEDDDPTWQEEGIADITKYNNTAVVVGNPDSFAFEESKSSVDEGESGKVKAIYDLVFGQSGIGQASALAIPAARGSSLDLGVMHGPDQTPRQKCTMEFWVWVPESIKKEIILVRRTFGSSADDLDTVCKAGDKSNLLWELGLHKSGELEFRTIAGKSVKTKPEKRDDVDDDDDDTPTSSVHFSRWNHICIIMKQESVTSSAVSLVVRGTRKTNAKSLSFSPPGFEVDDFSGASALDPKLEKSHLVYGLDHPKDFRMTELRVWALERKDDDIKTLMTEYLECAEIKRKFRIKIKKKSGGEKAGTIGLAPPKARGLLAPPGGLRPPGDTPAKGGLLAPPGGKKGRLMTPPKHVNKESKEESPANRDTAFGPSDFGTGSFDGFGTQPASATDLAAPVSFDSDGFGSNFDSDFKDDVVHSNPSEHLNNVPFEPDSEDIEFEEGMDQDDEEIEISPLWESAIPLSKQVRTSAASALIRGPPATRHFGGNRGGLPDYRELERFGVGAISICGSEKTIVWRDDQVPPGLTYPIGASGAIVSDQMDGEGSEFLCCFMAKDKRMVVFELSTRTIVVELQMTTKLNYWRFLPPEAGEDTLCFMLITPVGGFHWMPLDEQPRPRQVWKRGPELQGKKIVSYEEGGTNGYEGKDMLSKVGLVLVTDSADMVGGGSLEAWLVPVCGDSQVVCASYEILGACLCQPPGLEYEAFMPLLLFVVEENNELVVCVSAVTLEGENSIGLTEVMTDALIEQGPYSPFDFEPPSLAMGTYPEILCCSLGTTVVVIVRRKGLVVAYELADSGLELIAQENVGHYVVDAVMRYNASEGGAEIVLLMGDAENRRDGRVGTFCFRPAA